jgi:pyruvate dehydrogenase E2 component (dihydrolipoamide acetyltransferase)
MQKDNKNYIDECIRYNLKNIKHSKEPMTNIRKLIAKRMVDSKNISAPVTYFKEIDVSLLLEKKKKMNVSFNDLMVWFVAKALSKHRYLNSSLLENDIVLYEDINIGIAVNLKYGLLVPVIRNVDKKSITEISREIKEMIKKIEERKIIPDDLYGGTFTITNLGMLGISFFTPILNQPQVGILGVGSISDKLSMNGNKIKVKHVVPLSLTCDHRIIDGAGAVEFLNTLDEFCNFNI